MSTPKFTILLLFQISLAYSLLGQTNEKKITIYKKSLENINDDTTTFKKVLISNAKVGELIGYYKNGSICKVTESYNHSFGFEKTEYLFKNDKLIFVYKKQYLFEYNDSNEISTRFKVNFEGVYLFSNNKIILKIDKGEEKFEPYFYSGDPIAEINSATYFIILSMRNINKLRKRKNNVS